MSSLCFSDLPVSGHITTLDISGVLIICSLFVGCNIIGVFDGPIGKEKRDLRVVQSPPGCPVTS
jgi:hypothetical protein